MSKRYYIAYGSNLSMEQMAVRCPDARVAGKAVLKDWKLVFKVHADIEERKGSKVPVLIWEVSPQDEKALDRYEGYPSYYTKRDITVEMTGLDGGSTRDVTAFVYTMTKGHEVRMPWGDYYGVLEEGYERFGFDKEPLEAALKEAKEKEETA